VLEATWRLIEERSAWDIPALSRELVERSLHRDALNDIATEKGPEWELHGQRMAGIRYGEARQADLNLIDWTRPYSETTFSDDVRIPTRLGDGDRRVQFELPFLGPFGASVDELVVRGAWVAGVASDDYVGRVVASANGVTRFEFAQKTFMYDRFGLRKSSPHENEGHDDSP
jgi:CRISPR-associated endonuclease/helicase Cas3